MLNVFNTTIWRVSIFRCEWRIRRKIRNYIVA